MISEIKITKLEKIIDNLFLKWLSLGTMRSKHLQINFDELYINEKMNWRFYIFYILKFSYFFIINYWSQKVTTVDAS